MVRLSAEQDMSLQQFEPPSFVMETSDFEKRDVVPEHKVNGSASTTFVEEIEMDSEQSDDTNESTDTKTSSFVDLPLPPQRPWTNMHDYVREHVDNEDRTHLNRRQKFWKALDDKVKCGEFSLEFLEQHLLALEKYVAAGGKGLPPYLIQNDEVDAESSTASDVESDTESEFDLSEEHDYRLSCYRLRAIPDIRSATSSDYKRKTVSVPREHHAIDLLDDENILGPDGKSSSNQQAESVVSSTTTENEKRLPSRIRINSMPAKRALDSECGHRLQFGPLEPLVMLRPFYLLNHLEPTIRSRLREVRRTLRNKIGPALPTRENPKRKGEEDNMYRGGCFLNAPFPPGPDWEDLTLDECQEVVDDLQCVVDFIDQYINPLKKELREKPTMVRFYDLWYLFQPGTLIYVKEKRVPQKVWRVVAACGGRKLLNDDPTIPEWKRKAETHSPFEIDCYYLDWDGSRFIKVYHRFKIEKFPDVHTPQPVKSLAIQPFQVAEKDGLVNRKDLEARGRQFIDCTQVRHRYYSGRSLDLIPTGLPLSRPNANGTTQRVSSEMIESQVMVDFERAFETIPDWRPQAEDLMDAPDMTDETVTADGAETIDPDSVWYRRLRDKVVDEQSEEWYHMEQNGQGPIGENLLLLPDRVFAFVFRTRAWTCIQLGTDKTGQERLRPVSRREDAWKELELPDGHKDLVQSLIRSHFEKEESQKMDFDLIRDKGRGVIMLLHGVPGVGKTSTAECVAESECKPLLPITCGDLGTSARDVESKLQASFELAQAWDCILLLDEADIFLSERTVEDIERNALVSVFLRVLEYYSGILFLTTNRVGAIDEAFKSRIHMALYYPPLDKLKTKKIWRSQIKRVKQNHPDLKIDEETLIDYAEQLWQNQESGRGLGPVWNGRQIRNAFKSAVALAHYHAGDGEVELTKTNFEKVAQVSNEFNNYFWRVHGNKSDRELAAMNSIRDDSYQGLQSAHSLSSRNPAPQASNQQMFNNFAPPHSAPPRFGNQMSQPNQFMNMAPGSGMNAMYNPQFGFQQNYTTPMQQDGFSMAQRGQQSQQQVMQQSPQQIMNQPQQQSQTQAPIQVPNSWQQQAQTQQNLQSQQSQQSTQMLPP